MIKIIINREIFFVQEGCMRNRGLEVKTRDNKERFLAGEGCTKNLELEILFLNFTSFFDKIIFYFTVILDCSLGPRKPPIS